ncbi:MAG: copper(I)-binding protein [Halieaceae bacterium]|jgi:copper(I)-binding protein
MIFYFKALFAGCAIALCAAYSLAADADVDVGQGLELRAAWVRAMPPTQHMTAAYLQLFNPSDKGVEIDSVSASVGVASLHETRLENGRSSMRPVSTLQIPPGGTVFLQPGGLHMMLMDIETMPLEGETVQLCVRSNLGEYCADAPVQKVAQSSDSSQGHHHH